METVINLWNAYAELLTGRPHDTITAEGWVGVGFATAAIVLLLLLAFYLASYPLRRLGRWWRKRRVRKQALVWAAGEARKFQARGPIDKGGLVFMNDDGTVSEQPGKRAEEAALSIDDNGMVGIRYVAAAGHAPIIDKGDGMLHYQIHFTEPARSIDEAVKRIPYGSKVSEDAKPLSRKEFNAEKDENEATHEAMNGRFARIEERVAALEAMPCRMCGGEGRVESYDHEADELRTRPCPKCCDAERRGQE